ncbi:hypothetical protein JX265_011459 [Neoarthrinium moseri]|uniref:Uncharacterized protein n=1 Tax=Neoarthrinium moseri TaxID=1658444 RepID=A0A9Q0AJI2_9PEZI|nr:hypothetical protein JX266_001884 [Neoarthrinium moseri]KAI1856818.1 hypothetical protein JX265_011459 [Neoarthrinium moseri]
MAMATETLSLAGKVAIVTGSGRETGLGAGIANALARNGASIVINYVSDTTRNGAETLAKRLSTDYGIGAVAIQENIESQDGANNLIEKTLRLLKTAHIDILVNNAGCNLPGSTLDTPLENIQKQFSVNVFAAIYVVRATVPHMPRGGRIINIGSISSKLGLKSLPFYNAAKSAQDSLTHTWAAEFGRSHGITVNTVAPGPVDTDEQRKFARDNPEGYKAIQDLVDMTKAADRVGALEDIADAVLLLAQEKSRWITGQYIDKRVSIHLSIYVRIMPTDQSWTQSPPYQPADGGDSFDKKHEGRCAPFQWAAIFHKEDMMFENGTKGLVFYNSADNTLEHDLPCKVSCAHCRTPIMDEGRRMVLLFPTLIKFNNQPQRDAFYPHCHIFYSQRVVDIPDGTPKWDGLDGLENGVLLDDMP